MSELLASFIAYFTANSISDAFIYAILILLLTSIYLSYRKKAPRFTASTTNILTSLGILGTFAGIVVGLMDFDPKNIDGSIEILLEGLKTAFLTSLVGMASSILYKAAIGLMSNDKENTGEVGAEEIHSVMTEQLKAINELVSSIKGEGDTSLTSQIKNLRLDLKDGQQSLNNYFSNSEKRLDEFQSKLWSKMEEFGELLSKSATEQVINALKDVIVEFNDKLTEQFGDNFKRLDESVKKLVDWQENYKNQLEDMAVKYQLGVDSIGLTEKSVSVISEKAESIPATMEKLAELIKLSDDQLTELEHRLEAFKDLRDKAVEAMPQIREQLDNTLEIIESSVKSASGHYESMLDESNSMMNKFSNTANTSIDTMRTNLEQGAIKISSELENHAVEIGSRLAQASNDITDNITTASGALQNSASALVENSEVMKQQLEDAMVDLNGHLRVLASEIKDEAKETGNILRSANRELIDNTRQLSTESVDAIKRLQDRFETTLDEIFKIQAEAIHRTFESLEDQITESIAKTGQSVEKQVEVLDLQMQQEINRTMNELGSALSTITQQFTRDYQALVGEMSKVVNTNSRRY